MGGLFICWSKPRSRRVAEALRGWLPPVLGRTGKPFLSVEITKGRVWLTEVSRALKSAKAAIVCLTPENLDSPWIHFEAGTVARSLGGSSVFVYLHGLAPEEVEGPLQSFQGTVSTRDDTRRLLAALARTLGRGTGATRGWAERFDRSWPLLEAALRAVPPPSIAEICPALGELFQHKTFVEPIPECKDKDWKARFRRLVATREKLAAQGAHVRRLAAPPIVALFDELQSLLDGYEMEMATLVDNKPVATAPDGRLVFDVEPPPGERRRARIEQIVEILWP